MQGTKMSSKKKTSPFTQKKNKGGSIIKYVITMSILAIIVVALVVAPALGGGASRNDFGKFGNIPIRYEQGNTFYNIVSNNAGQIQSQEYDNVIQFETARYRLWNNAFTEVVYIAAQKYTLKESGFEVSDNKLNEMIIESDSFRNEYGEFDNHLYQTTSQADKDRIRESWTDYLYTSRFQTDNVDGIYRNPSQLDFIREVSPQERKISYVSFDFSDYPDNLVRQQALDNSQSFQSRTFSRMTFSTEKKANEVLDLLNNQDKSFEELAAEYSTDLIATEGGLLGNRFYYELADELGEESADALFSMEVNQVSEAIESNYGWFLYRTESQVQEANVDDPQTISTVRMWLNWNRPEIIDQWISEQAEILLADSQERDWQIAAVAMGKNVVESGYFGLNWGGSPLVGSMVTSTGDRILYSANNSEDFFTKVFSLELGQVSEPIHLGNSTILVRLEDQRDSQGQMDSSYTNYFLKLYNTQLWKEKVLESDDYIDNFDQAFYQFFPPSIQSES